MSIDRRVKLPKEQDAAILKKLLGSLELEVMECMWQISKSTVRQVTKIIDCKRPIAYTTVMTVMGHLTDKGLLTRTKYGKRYYYRVAQSKDEFLRQTSRNVVHTMLDNFGDLAVEVFWEEINEVGADRFEQLRDLVQETTDESNSRARLTKRW